jgi:hypothetical protein
MIQVKPISMIIKRQNANLCPKCLSRQDKSTHGCEDTAPPSPLFLGSRWKNNPETDTMYYSEYYSDNHVLAAASLGIATGEALTA